VVVTPKNRDWIKRRAAEKFFEEWQKTTEKANEAIEKAILDVKELIIGNQGLNRELGEMVVSILRRMHALDGDRIFTIYDLGAGDGDTTLAVLNAMDLYPHTKGLAPYCKFRLLDPGSQRLRVAEAKIAAHPLSKLLLSRPVSIVGSSDFFESDVGKGSVDIFISNAVLHHFPFPDHYRVIREKLAEDGVLVAGDWHNTILSHPAFFVPLLEAIGADTYLVNEFMNRFGIKEGDRKKLEEGLTPRQKACHQPFIDFIKAQSVRLKEVGEKLCILECLESFEDRGMNMRVAGFEDRIDVLRKEHVGFGDIERNKNLVFADSDLAGVVAVGKIKAPPPPTKKAPERFPRPIGRRPLIK
jgi:SAM-dependent methyltransferase